MMLTFSFWFLEDTPVSLKALLLHVNSSQLAKEWKKKVDSSHAPAIKLIV